MNSSVSIQPSLPWQRTTYARLLVPVSLTNTMGRFFGISDKSCKIFFSEFYQIMPCIMFADN